MDTIKGVCLHDKESLLTEDYRSLPSHKNRTRNSRCVDILYVGIFFTAVLACIVSCVCAIYCHKALSDIKKLQHDTEHGISEARTTQLPQFSEWAYDIDTNSDEREDYDFLDDLDEVEIEELYSDDIDENEVDEDENVDGSGDRVRKRRSNAKSCEAKCQKRKGNRRNRCLKKCKTGGRQTKQAINLPAAQFEVKFTDEEIKDTVKAEFNSYVNTEDVPLKIFKAANWVDERKSPVKFNNSIAKAKSAGIYLVYAQAYIGGKEPEKAVVVVQKRGGKDLNAFSCRTGVHPDHYDSMSSQLQTCSVLSLMNVEEGDTIEIQRSATTSQIILDKDKTYFGIVQLSGSKKTRN
ncbi:uncharacterized protein LOC123553840 isoform X2 [Mercenaria mercenaria]|uniref:uncharacterized protein LOC123553840 isoform X2 n=1 Tax=Mercenaria mercenaria TaxID=6596 RepID=UPI00234F4684|nr:uncharacterized protein LOC123553840 isoform X2 [Mercenaria mercenaria]